MSANPHQFKRDTEPYLISCAAPGCEYAMYVGNADWTDSQLRGLFSDHARQFESGGAPDIEVDWVLSACCSVCPDKTGNVEMDGDALTCSTCGTSWDMDGEGGETDGEVLEAMRDVDHGIALTCGLEK